MADGEVFNTRTGDNNIDGVLIGTRWNSTALTFAFPTLSTYFNTSGSGYEISPGVFDNSYVTGFSAANVAWQSAVTTILDGYARVSNLSYTLVSPSTQADVVFAMTNTGSVPTANGRFPSYGPNEGHQWYNIGNYDATPVLGTYTWATIMHETGHTMGLAHGHSPDTITAIPGVVMNSDRDSMEFSVMTYRSYIGQVINGYTNETFGYAQTLMMYDIAAIQLLYGADYTTNSGSNVYTFSTTTGEMFIDGVSQGLPGANRIFRTVWDGNGVDTFNLSNYSTNLHVDLTPGGWSTFSDVQLANLGDGNFARGNVFNSLLFNNDSRSLIENVVGGTGDDTIVGNRAANNIQGGNGSDTIVGGGGGDTIIGGAGIDIIYGDSTAVAPSGIGLGTGIYNHGSVHDTIATAFNLTNTFSTANNANIVNSTTIPHTTMHYSSAAGDLAQFYAVTLTAGSTIKLDIDATTGGLDSYIRLLAADGTTILALNDDGAGDVGSTGTFFLR